MAKESNHIYAYIRSWFDFAFANQDIVRPIHGCIYLWQVELNNRLGWVVKFGSPATQTMAACGINNYKTYKTAFDDLIKWGFIEIITESRNQHQSCIIALVKNAKADTKALDYALVKNAKADNKALPEQLPKHLPHNNTTIPIDQETNIPDSKESDPPPVLIFEAPILKPKKKKKEKNLPGKKKEEKLYTQMVAIYFKWHNDVVGCDPIMSGGNGLAMVNIVSFIESQVRKKSLESGLILEDKEVNETCTKTWKILLDAMKTDKVEPFFRKQTKLTQIYSNLTNIINQLKNGQSTSGARANIKGHQHIDIGEIYQQFVDMDNRDRERQSEGIER